VPKTIREGRGDDDECSLIGAGALLALLARSALPARSALLAPTHHCQNQLGAHGMATASVVAMQDLVPRGARSILALFESRRPRAGERGDACAAHAGSRTGSR
jgi:hypothetical protein